LLERSSMLARRLEAPLPRRRHCHGPVFRLSGMRFRRYPSRRPQPGWHLLRMPRLRPPVARAAGAIIQRRTRIAPEERQEKGLTG
jgi:hypothetical protein